MYVCVIQVISVNPFSCKLYRSLGEMMKHRLEFISNLLLQEGGKRGDAENSHWLMKQNFCQRHSKKSIGKYKSRKPMINTKSIIALQQVVIILKIIQVQILVAY